MKIIIAPLVLFLSAVPAFAVKACEELKSEITAKLDAKGVKDYQVEIVAAADVKDQQVIGSCEGGAKKIAYTKGSGKTAPASPAAAKKPAPAKK